MDALQNSTNQAQALPAQDDNVQPQITPQQSDYIAFTAFGGLIPDPEGEKVAIKMTATELAEKLGVSRTTLYTWRDSIPNFWELVNEKRREIGSKERLSNVWNGVYLKATAGNPEAAKLYLANFDPDFRMPMQKHEHDIGDGLAEAMAIARKRASKRIEEAIEGEVVDEAPGQ